MTATPSIEHDRFRLTAEVVARSEADDWSEAKHERTLGHVYPLDPDAEPAACLCGHRPIREVCVLVNRLNGVVVRVGNVCVRRFLDLDPERVFVVLRRVPRNPAAALTSEAVEFAAERGWLTEWEARFACDTCRRNRLSPKQRAIWERINAKVLGLTGGEA